MGKQFKTPQQEIEHENRLAAFSNKSDEELNEGTSSYYKWAKAGDKADFTFEGIDVRNLDQKDPTKMSECAILKNLAGEQFIMAQTIIVKELKKKWEETKETGFPVRIIYKGTIGEGSEAYQSFRLMFE